MIGACPRGRVHKVEGVVRPHFLAVLKDDVVIAGYPGGDTGAGEAVPGIALNLTAKINIVPHQVQLVILVKTEVEGGQHKFVHTEGIPLQNTAGAASANG